MSKADAKELLQFLNSFDQETISIVTWLRDFAWDLCPNCNELIYDNYNAVAVGWSPTDRVSHTICSIAIGRSSNNIHFGFYWGSDLDDPKHMLKGEGNQYRYILVTDTKTFPKAYVKQLVKQAYANVLAKIKDPMQIKERLTIVKSVSDKKRTKKGTPSNKKKVSKK